MNDALTDVRSTFDLDSISVASGRQRSVRSIAIIGAGGHGRELADIVLAIAKTAGGISLLGIVDDGDPDLGLLARSGVRFLGSTSRLDSRDIDVFIGVGNPATRARIDTSLGAMAVPLVHPSASMGSNTDVGPGSVLAQGVIVTTNVTIGRHSHVNIGSTISHDCAIGDHVTICPGVHLTGDVRIGDRVFIGAGATVLPGLTIGDDAVVGAGAVVTSDVRRAETVAGVPAIVLER